MSEHDQQQPMTTAHPAFQHLVQTLTEVVQDPLAADAEERLTAAAYAANAEMYGRRDG